MFDFTRLRFSPDMPVWVWPPMGLRPQPDWPRGGLFLDGDRNGRFSRDVDFAFWVDLELGPPFKVFYSPMVTRRALEQRVFGVAWPAHIATVEELEARARRVDALPQIPQVVRRFPRLAVLVFESQEHHVSGFGGARHVNAVATSQRLARGSRALGSLQSRYPLPDSGDGENSSTDDSIPRDESARRQEHRRSARTGSRARRPHRWSGHVRRGVRAGGPHAVECLDAYLKPRSCSVTPVNGASRRCNRSFGNGSFNRIHRARGRSDSEWQDCGVVGRDRFSPIDP